MPCFPLPLSVRLTSDAESWRQLPVGWTELPLPPHPGAFAAQRRHHIHEGVDLYCPDKTPVLAIEAGQVVFVGPFTGAAVGSPWWHETSAVMVSGAKGIFLYGELLPNAGVATGLSVAEGQVLGYATPVLKSDKGRPLCMLHLERYTLESARATPFPGNSLNPLPDWVLDPTEILLPFCAKNS